MRKLTLFSLVFLVLATSVFAASVSRSMPARIEPGATLTVTFSITSAISGELFTLEDQLPAGWAIKDWSVTGSTEAKAQITTRFNPPRYCWSFNPSGSSATISYTVDVPSTEGTYSFDAVWFDRGGQSRGTQAVVVKAIRCGDGTCEGAETTGNCPADCRVTVTTLPATTRTMAPVTTTLPAAGAKAKIPPLVVIAIVVAIVVIILLIISAITKKKKKAAEFPEITKLDRKLKRR